MRDSFCREWSLLISLRESSKHDGSDEADWAMISCPRRSQGPYGQHNKSSHHRDITLRTGSDDRCKQTSPEGSPDVNCQPNMLLHVRKSGMEHASSDITVVGESPSHRVDVRSPISRSCQTHLLDQCKSALAEELLIHRRCASDGPSLG